VRPSLHALTALPTGHNIISSAILYSARARCLPCWKSIAHSAPMPIPTCLYNRCYYEANPL
jgi:hypothetical protein